MPGKSKTFSFIASIPGVFMYHCGTAPAFLHIANGMYGAIVVEPRNMPPADKEYVLVSSEWYLNSAGERSPAALDAVKAQQMTPDWVTWNGYAAQYKTHPLTAQPGQTVRFWVVDAGPSLNTEFHVVGTILARAWINADLVDAPQHDIQTAIVPAGGGGVFDVKIDHPGIYPFVSHSFASVAMGEVGLLNVGGVPGTMNHWRILEACDGERHEQRDVHHEEHEHAGHDREHRAVRVVVEERVLEHPRDDEIGERAPAHHLEEAPEREVARPREQHRVHEQQRRRAGEARDGDAERRMLRQVRSDVDHAGGDERHRRGAELRHRREAARAQLASLVMITSVATCIAPVTAAA